MPSIILPRAVALTICVTIVCAQNGTYSNTTSSTSLLTTTLTSFSTITAPPSTATSSANASLAWQTTGFNPVIPNLVQQYCKNVNAPEGITTVSPCDAVCPMGNQACLDAANSEAATCYPQWTAYLNSSAAWASVYRPGSTTFTYTEIDTYPISIYSSLSTDSSYSKALYQGGYFNPVYAFGTPSVSTSLDTWVQTWDFPAASPQTEKLFTWTYTNQGSVVTSIAPDLAPVTTGFTLPTPACSITSVQSLSCGSCTIGK